MIKEDADNKIITFGCRLNSYESEAIKEALKKTDQKNLLVFNSCAVTAEAERELRSAVRRAKRDNPDVRIVVTGCAAQIDPEKYAKMALARIVRVHGGVPHGGAGVAIRIRNHSATREGQTWSQRRTGQEFGPRTVEPAILGASEHATPRASYSPCKLPKD